MIVFHFRRPKQYPTWASNKHKYRYVMCTRGPETRVKNIRAKDSRGKDTRAKDSRAEISIGWTLGESKLYYLHIIINTRRE